MTLNWMGLIAAAATFSGVWIGHVAVRKIEYHSPTIWLPSSMALVLGFLLELGALMSDNAYLSAALGIFGITILWDALEFWRQHRRVRRGHAPANPNNPRHVRLLHSSVMATTIDWLDRNPVGKPLPADEPQRIREGAQ